MQIPIGLEGKPLLLKLVLIYAIYSGNGQEDAHLGAIAGSAQELLDVLKILPKLRNGGPRCFQRLINCIEQMLILEW